MRLPALRLIAVIGIVLAGAASAAGIAREAPDDAEAISQWAAPLYWIPPASGHQSHASTRQALVAGLSVGVSALIGGSGYLYWRKNTGAPGFLAGSSLLVSGTPGPDGDPIGVQIRASLQQSSRLSLWNNSRLGEVWALMGRQGSPAPRIPVFP